MTSSCPFFVTGKREKKRVWANFLQCKNLPDTHVCVYDCSFVRQMESRSETFSKVFVIYLIKFISCYLNSKVDEAERRTSKENSTLTKDKSCIWNEMQDKNEE